MDQDDVSTHLAESMAAWRPGDDDPAAQDAFDRSVAAHEAFAALPGVTFQADEQVVIVVHPGFELLDMTGPYQFLASMIGATVHLATTGPDLTPVRSSGGMLVVPTIALADAPPEPTVLMVPGGETNVLLADHDAMAALARLGQSAGILTSVCSGSLALAAAGLLQGRRATSPWAVRHLLTGYGAVEVDARVVDDGDVLTAAGVTAGMDLAIRLVARLRGDDYARFLELGAEYAPQPPFGTGTPDAASSELVALSRDFLAPLEHQLRAPHTGPRSPTRT